MPYSPAGDVINNLEAKLGIQLDDEQQAEIELWQKGRDLQSISGHHGWSTVLEMLQSYAIDATRRCVNTDPLTDEARVEHAIAFAANRIYTNFINDVDAAIQASQQTPEVLKQGIRSAMPVESTL